jgi:WD40 repeat protein
MEHGLAPISDVTFSSDGKYLASSSSDGSIRIWETATGKPLVEPVTTTGTLAGSDSGGLAVIPDGTRAVVGLGDGRVLEWNLATGQLAWTIKTNVRHVFALDYTPDGKTLVVSGSNLGIELRHTSPHFATLRPVSCSAR